MVEASAQNVTRLLQEWGDGDEEALRKLGPDDSFLKARTLGGLARYLGVTGENQKLMAYASRSEERRVGKEC